MQVLPALLGGGAGEGQQRTRHLGAAGGERPGQGDDGTAAKLKGVGRPTLPFRLLAGAGGGVRGRQGLGRLDVNRQCGGQGQDCWAHPRGGRQ